ncbi:YchJ family protein [Larsenimonas suaedae]|uniref:YchJ family protein n=1 Tax=Larsenimonas suaedae TaxID=1851019 RepID=A0ABU1GS54_9GAMM|nr:YchJ family protein [Larsenimonas suaedae]MCM2972348.1 YchJ family protein [Larsenimonas suaedae]MDR5894856.1 YchJ family protein [Larsenimonas suaedae]
MTTSCPCQSGLPYNRCCQIFHDRVRPAPTCEALMRSRYSAFALGGLGAYLLETWAPQSLERKTLDADTLSRPEVAWTGLEVLSHTEKRRRGEVEFKAHFLAEGVEQVMHERSRFVREDGLWYYLDGVQNPTPEPVSRNAPCPCGSGKKHKRCCGA